MQPADKRHANSKRSTTDLGVKVNGDFICHFLSAFPAGSHGAESSTYIFLQHLFLPLSETTPPQNRCHTVCAVTAAKAQGIGRAVMSESNCGQNLRNQW